MTAPIQFNDLFNQHLMKSDEDFLLVLESRVDANTVVAEISQHQKHLETLLLRHGAILFRGVGLSPIQFRDISSLMHSEEMPYTNGATSRAQYADGLYLASEFPKGLILPQHHEMSYMPRWPMKVFFYCDVPAKVGGETPVCSSRTFMKKLDQRIIKRFGDLGVQYLRNYSKEFTSEWDKAFLTDKKSEVEKICRESGMRFEWRPENRLRTFGNAQGLATHPKTGEVVWHNHINNFTTRSASSGAMTPLLRMLAKGYPPEVIQQLRTIDHLELPTNCCYGDGSLIEQSVLEEVSETLEANKVSFPWHKGDFIMLDNMLTFHGRNSFEGERRILAILKEPYSIEVNVETLAA